MESAERSVEHRHDRLAELVWHLTDCEPTEALAAALIAWVVGKKAER